MVQECYKYVDSMSDLTIKLRLIDTLRTVTAGKVWTQGYHFEAAVVPSRRVFKERRETQ